MADFDNDRVRLSVLLLTRMQVLACYTVHVCITVTAMEEKSRINLRKTRYAIKIVR